MLLSRPSITRGQTRPSFWGALRSATPSGLRACEKIAPNRNTLSGTPWAPARRLGRRWCGGREPAGVPAGKHRAHPLGRGPRLSQAGSRGKAQDRMVGLRSAEAGGPRRPALELGSFRIFSQALSNGGGAPARSCRYVPLLNVVSVAPVLGAGELRAMLGGPPLALGSSHRLPSLRRQRPWPSPSPEESSRQRVGSRGRRNPRHPAGSRIPQLASRTQLSAKDCKKPLHPL